MIVIARISPARCIFRNAIPPPFTPGLNLRAPSSGREGRRGGPGRRAGAPGGRGGTQGRRRALAGRRRAGRRDDGGQLAGERRRAGRRDDARALAGGRRARRRDDGRALAGGRRAGRRDDGGRSPGRGGAAQPCPRRLGDQPGTPRRRTAYGSGQAGVRGVAPRARSVPGLGPAAPGAEGHLQRDAQVEGPAHRPRDQVAQRVELTGGDLEAPVRRGPGAASGSAGLRPGAPGRPGAWPP